MIDLNELKRKSWDYKNYPNQTCKVGVKTLLKELQEPFDAVAIATKCVANPNSQYFGRTVEDVVSQWTKGFDNAGNRGNLLDSYIESVYAQKLFDKSGLNDTEKLLLNQFDKFYSEYWRHISLVGREVWVNSPEGISGRMDALYERGENNLLVDWKQNDISMSNNRKKLIGPAKCLDDCSYNTITFQLFTYKYFLKTYYDIDITNTIIGWVQPFFYKILKPSFSYDEVFIKECIDFCVESLKNKENEK